MNILNILKPFVAVAVALTLYAPQATVINFTSQIDVILEDNGAAEFSGFGVGTPVTGFIDDQTANGQITIGTDTVTFTCCIAAGGLDVSNNDVLDADSAALLNSLAGITLYSAGDMIDVINLEGDVILASGNRIEVGLSYVFDACTFHNTSLSNYPFNPGAVRLAVFFVLEQNGDDDIYDILGTISSSDHTDIDNDGITDCSDNCLAVANSNQYDSNEDGFGNFCDADFDGDCNTNFADFTRMVDLFLMPATDEDLTGDTMVNFGDVFEFSQMFLQQPGPSGIAQCP